MELPVRMPLVWVFGDLGDLASVIITVVSILIYILNHVFDKQRRAATRPPRPVEEQEAADAPPRRIEPTQVEAFLREVARLRQQQAAPEAVVAEAVAPPQRPRLSETTSTLGSGVGTHTEQYLGEHLRQLSQRVSDTVDTSDMGKGVRQEADRMAVRKIGRLKHAQPAAAEEQAPPAPLPLAAIFSDPEQFRRAFVAQEVLDPPRL
jgi:hypothetical protein